MTVPKLFDAEALHLDADINIRQVAKPFEIAPVFISGTFLILAQILVPIPPVGMKGGKYGKLQNAIPGRPRVAQEAQVSFEVRTHEAGGWIKPFQLDGPHRLHAEMTAVWHVDVTVYIDTPRPTDVWLFRPDQTRLAWGGLSGELDWPHAVPHEGCGVAFDTNDVWLAGRTVVLSEDAG